MKRSFVLALVAVAAIAAPCLYDLEMGVHFRGENVDFGTPPVRFAAYYGENDGGEDPRAFHVDWRPGTRYMEDEPTGSDSDWNLQQPVRQQKANAGLVTAAKLEDAGNIPGAITMYRNLNSRGLGDPSFIHSRIEVLSLALKATSQKGLAAYLAATRPIGGNDRAMPLLSEAAPFLHPYIAYARAAKLYDQDLTSRAAQAFEGCAQSYPKTDRAEAALIMAARSRLQDDHPAGNPALAKSDLERLLAQYPRSRFKSNAIGWLGRADFELGEYPEAVSEYGRQYIMGQHWNASLSLFLTYKALGKSDSAGLWAIRLFRSANNPNDAVLAVQLLSKTAARMSPSQGESFAKILESSPNDLATYIHERSRLTEASKADLENLDAMAVASMRVNRRDPSAHLFAVTASLEYGLGRIPDARRHAWDARILSRTGSDDWALGQYLLASTDKALGRSGPAIDNYKAMIDRAPHSYLVGGAREAMAFLYDREGQLGKALDLYYDLGYEPDAGYLVDAKMTVAQLKGYVQTHPHSVHRHALIYTLGERELRENRIDAAESEFRRLGRAEVARLAALAGTDYNGGAAPNPLDVCAKLRELESAIARATSAESEAKAMYALASFYYTSDGLLLYDAPVWQGSRASSFGFYWSPYTATSLDKQVLVSYHYRTECLAHAVDICQDILKRYPKTSVAPYAAYRAACGLEHLSNYNSWWRWQDHAADLQGHAVDLMELVSSRYANSPLAKAARKYGPVFVDQRRQDRANTDWGYDDSRFLGLSPKIIRERQRELSRKGS